VCHHKQKGPDPAPPRQQGQLRSPTTEYFDDLELLETKVDWQLQGATMWSDTADDPTRATRRAAEFLAHRQVPWALIGQVVARTMATGRAVREILNDAGSSQQVIVRRGWYYNGEKYR
jgi:hypothetical protein